MNPVNQQELDDLFTYHAPFGSQPRRYAQLRASARQFAEMVLLFCPSSRERSLAVTAIQQASMWANASIAINEKPVSPEDHASSRLATRDEAAAFAEQVLPPEPAVE